MHGQVGLDSSTLLVYHIQRCRKRNCFHHQACLKVAEVIRWFRQWGKFSWILSGGTWISGRKKLYPSKGKGTAWADALFQDSAPVWMRSSLFWFVTKRRLVVSYRRWRTTYRSPNTSNYRSTLCDLIFHDLLIWRRVLLKPGTKLHGVKFRQTVVYWGIRMSFITALQMTATHHQSAHAHFYDYFRLASWQMLSLLSLDHVDRMTSIYMEGTYQFVLLSQGATRSLNTQRTSFPQQATRFLPLWRSQHKTPCLQVSSPQPYITESHR
jgi:hypothetical protein